MENQHDVTAEDFEKAAKLIREGDKEGLAAHASRFVDERVVAALLDGIPGAYERVQLGLEQARAGRTERIQSS